MAPNQGASLHTLKKRWSVLDHLLIFIRGKKEIVAGEDKREKPKKPKKAKSKKFSLFIEGSNVVTGAITLTIHNNKTTTPSVQYDDFDNFD